MNAAVLSALGIALAGGLGSAVRYLVDGAFPVHLRDRFPWGIMAINLSGSLALGLLAGLAGDHPVARVIGVGFLGGYTTFSTASLDTVKLLRGRRTRSALVNGPGMLVAGAGLATLGMVLGRSLAGG